MSAKHDKDVDAISGVETTGHEWDGIKELNNPLPSWWLWTFYITIVWGVVYTVLYPAWPLISTATAGVLGYSTRAELAQTMDAARAAQADRLEKIAALDLEAIAADADLAAFSRSAGAAAFRINCSQCHGQGAAGAVGYPNLLDDDWIWGGGKDEIYRTIAYGIRHLGPDGFTTSDTRDSQMPAFGRDDLLTDDEIAALVGHVRALSGQEPIADATKAAEAATLFADNCASCHGDDGKGLRELGAPNLTDAIWLYGGDVASLTATMETGRGGRMPAFLERLPDTTVKQLALYVHGLGGGE